MTQAPPQRILLSKLRHHGDILLVTPLARVLKQHFPEVCIDMLVYRETTPMLLGNADIHAVHAVDRNLKGWRKLAAQLGLLVRLREQHYDWVIHLSDQWQGALLARFTGAPLRIGFDYPKRRGALWASGFSHLAPLAASDSVHAVEQNLLALQPLGIACQTSGLRCVPPIRPQDRDAIRCLLNAQQINTPFIVVHPAARWFFKCWEDEYFAAVIQALADEGWPVVLTCAPDAHEQALLASILQRVNSPRVVSLAGQLTLNTLAALIEQCRLFIGVDSVPMHLAAACGKDTVALFGPSKVNEWRPWQTRYRLIHAADHGPLIAPDEVDTTTQQRYLANIPVAPVLAAARELLAMENPGV